MADVGRTLLRAVASAIVVVAAVTQIVVIAYYWWDLGREVSCERLIYWGEWIECLHGYSHLYIQMTELALGSWLVAGLSMLLGRSVPAYISVVIPAALGFALFRFSISYWHQAVTPYRPFGGPTPWDILLFTMTIGVIAVFFVGPAIGGWLLGLNARIRRRSLRAPIAN